MPKKEETQRAAEKTKTIQTSFKQCMAEIFAILSVVTALLRMNDTEK